MEDPRTTVPEKMSKDADTIDRSCRNDCRTAVVTSDTYVDPAFTIPWTLLELPPAMPQRAISSANEKKEKSKFPHDSLRFVVA
jgi:hypothetical protein